MHRFKQYATHIFLKSISNGVARTFDIPIGIFGFPILKARSYQVKKQVKITLYYLSLTSYIVCESKAEFQVSKEKETVGWSAYILLFLSKILRRKYTLLELQELFMSPCDFLFCLIFQQLLAGSRVSEADKHRQTCLHLAAANNTASIISVLLENGIDPDAMDEKGNNGMIDVYYLLPIMLR